MTILFKSIRALLVLAVAAGIAVYLYKNSPAPGREARPPATPIVDVQSVQPETVVMQVEVFGTVSPRRTVTLSAEVSGTIDYLHPEVKDGAVVSDGTLLVRLDARTYSLEEQSARIGVEQAEVELARMIQEKENLEANQHLVAENAGLLRQELDRVDRLAKDSFASRTDLDKTRRAEIESRLQLQEINNNLLLADIFIQQKKNSLALARVSHDKALLALDKTRVVSPFQGVVVRKYVESGEFVAASQPLVSLFEAGKVDVEVSVPLERLQWINPLFAAGERPSVTVSATHSGPTRSWTGKLTRKKAMLDETTRTLPLVIEIDPLDQDQDLDLPRPGLFVRCRIQGVTVEGAFVLPRHLVRPGDEVFIVENQKLIRKPVSVVRWYQDTVTVTGLESGDRVITSPLPGAVNGMAVLESQPETPAEQP